MLLLHVELSSRYKTTVECQATFSPCHHCILYIGYALIVANITRLAYIHHALHAQSFAQVVLITQITAVQIEATVVVIGSETSVEVSKHLNNGFALRLFIFCILRLCSDAAAGNQSCHNHLFCRHIHICFNLTMQRYDDGISFWLQRRYEKIKVILQIFYYHLIQIQE